MIEILRERRMIAKKEFFRNLNKFKNRACFNAILFYRSLVGPHQRICLCGRTWHPSHKQLSAMNEWVARWIEGTKGDVMYHRSPSNTKAISFMLGLSDFAARNWTCDDCMKMGKNYPCGCGRFPLPSDPDPWPGKEKGEHETLTKGIDRLCSGLL